MVSRAGDWLEVTVLNSSTRALKKDIKVCDQALLVCLHILGHCTAHCLKVEVIKIMKHNGNTIDPLYLSRTSQLHDLRFILNF